MLKLGDEIQEFYEKKFGKVATAPMLTHLQRELSHAVLHLLLDDDLLHAYTDGEAIKLYDGEMRRFSPNFYSIVRIIRKSLFLNISDIFFCLHLFQSTHFLHQISW